MQTSNQMHSGLRKQFMKKCATGQIFNEKFKGIMNQNERRPDFLTKS